MPQLVTQLPLLRTATWPRANNGHFTNVVFGIHDGGDDDQGTGGGASDAGRALVVMVRVLVTVLAKKVVS